MTTMMTTKRGSPGVLARIRITLGLLVLAAAAAGTVEATAQTPPDRETRVGCLTGAPLPECKSFWIVEMQGSVALWQTSRPVDYGGGQYYPQGAFGEYEFGWNLGHMVNVSPGLALGGLVTVGTGNSDALTGIRLRARRWMGSDWSVEFGGGVLRTHASNSRFPGVNGLTTDVRLNIRDHGSFFVRWDAVDLPEVRQPENGYHDPGGVQQGVLLGVDLGSAPALAGTGVLALGYAVLLGSWLANSH